LSGEWGVPLRTILPVIVALVLLCPSGATTQSRSQTAPPPEARVDINHASVEELIKIPGMTRSWAGRIVRFRPYRSKQDLLDRGVLPGDVYERIKDYVVAHREKQ
jgi:DNA uptake protein ComE-like DNA-binding protein